MKHFTYGSNMLSAEMRRYVPTATKLGVGTLSSFKLKFEKASRDGSAKCNAQLTKSADDQVIGVLYEIDEVGMRRLADKEGGYRECEVEVDVNGAKVRASVFVAMAKRINDSLKPYDWYKELVIEGARESGIPDAYVEQVLAVESIPDADRLRADSRRSVLSPTTNATENRSNEAGEARTT
jgi:hypothetical protein